MKVLAQIKTFLKDEEGASGIEYALLAVMVAVALSAFVGTGAGSISGKITSTFTKVLNALSTT